MLKKYEYELRGFGCRYGFVLWMCAACVLALPAISHASLVNFEGLADAEPVTNQYFGVLFVHTTALQAGASLNEFEFPPHSGINAAFDDGGPILLDFAAPMKTFQAYFTYLAPLTLTAFDASNTVLMSVDSGFSDNTALSGDGGSIPNELLTIISSGIRHIEIAGLNTGSSFVVDDITFQTELQPIPEPDALSLTIVGLGALLLSTFSRRRGGTR